MAFSASLDALESVLEETPPSQIQAILDERHDENCIQTIPVSSNMRNLINMAHSSNLNGALRHLQLEGIAFQLLALQLHAVSQSGQAMQPVSEDILGAVEAAKMYLLSDLRHPPTLSELAEHVSLSEKQLNSGFKKAYGATAFELLRNERLEAARMILESEDVLLKQVAHRVGYNHVTNCINAYKARFGEPPRRHLK